MEISSLSIKEFRERHKLTQLELADLLKMSARSIQNYEAGFTIPKSKAEYIKSIFEKHNKLRIKEIQEYSEETFNKNIALTSNEPISEYSETPDDIENFKNILQPNIEKSLKLLSKSFEGEIEALVKRLTEEKFENIQKRIQLIQNQVNKLTNNKD